MQEFEMQKELEKKKMDEEKKRIRKDKIMLEKSSRDRKSNFDQKAHEEIEELQAKVSFWNFGNKIPISSKLDLDEGSTGKSFSEALILASLNS